MIGIHPVHRRLAELQIKDERLGGYHFTELTYVGEVQPNANQDLAARL